MLPQEEEEEKQNLNPDKYGHFSSTTESPDHQPTENKNIITCVLVGDQAIGKTSLVISYISNGFPSEYVPTAFDKYSVLITINGDPYDLQISDTAGRTDFDVLRPFCYPNVDVYLLCFSVVRPSSFKNLKLKWLKEIRQFNPQVPLVLVGTQIDLKCDVKILMDLANSGEKIVSEEEAMMLAREIGASGYMQCSALTQKNLKETFDFVIGVGLRFIGEGRSKKNTYQRNSFFRFSKLSSKRSSILSVHIVQKNSVKMKVKTSMTPGNIGSSLNQNDSSSHPLSKSWFRKSFCCCA